MYRNKSGLTSVKSLKAENYQLFDVIVILPGESLHLESKNFFASSLRKTK